MILATSISVQTDANSCCLTRGIWHKSRSKPLFAPFVGQLECMRELSVALKARGDFCNRDELLILFGYRLINLDSELEAYGHVAIDMCIFCR